MAMPFNICCGVDGRYVYGVMEGYTMIQQQLTVSCNNVQL